MADICPVGAITEKEFRFKRRVWKLKKNHSICTGCSTGCNVTIEHDRNEVFRLKPHENQSVNKWWLCDEGRLTYRKMNEKKSRIHHPFGGVLERISKVFHGKKHRCNCGTNQRTEAAASRGSRTYGHSFEQRRIIFNSKISERRIII
ncbi:MAG: hypothetical protein Ct9H300mP21_04090 [Pseudomonadota bacterium]|nr:MAG: hypothetical protein Ct9H300mP21_04090 [Pseudomonadota bacterium]